MARSSVDRKLMVSTGLRGMPRNKVYFEPRKDLELRWATWTKMGGLPIRPDCTGLLLNRNSREQIKDAGGTCFPLIHDKGPRTEQRWVVSRHSTPDLQELEVLEVNKHRQDGEKPVHRVLDGLNGEVNLSEMAEILAPRVHPTLDSHIKIRIRGTTLGRFSLDDPFKKEEGK